MSSKELYFAYLFALMLCHAKTKKGQHIPNEIQESHVIKEGIFSFVGTYCEFSSSLRKRFFFSSLRKGEAFVAISFILQGDCYGLRPHNDGVFYFFLSLQKNKKEQNVPDGA